MSVPNPSAASAASGAKKPLRSVAGILLGVLFVVLYYPGIFLLACLVSGAQPDNRAAQILLGGLGVLVLVPFFWLGRLLTKKLGCGRNAFPAGAFLAADALLAAIPLADLLNAARLLKLAGGDKVLAQQYAMNCAVLIFALVLLVISWLISVFWRVFRRFAAMTEAYEREANEAAKAKEATAAVPPATAVSPTAALTVSGAPATTATTATTASAVPPVPTTPTASKNITAPATPVAPDTITASSAAPAAEVPGAPEESPEGAHAPAESPSHEDTPDAPESPSHKDTPDTSERLSPGDTPDVSERLSPGDTPDASEKNETPSPEAPRS